MSRQVGAARSRSTVTHISLAKENNGGVALSLDPDDRWFRVCCPDCGAHVTIPPKEPKADCSVFGTSCGRSLPEID